MLITGGDSPLDDDGLEDWCFSAVADHSDELPGPQLLPVFRFRHRRIARQVAWHRLSSGGGSGLCAGAGAYTTTH